MRAAIVSLVCGVSLLVVAPPTFAKANAGQAVSKPSDQALDERIEARLHNDPTLKQFDINVSVDGGVTTLTGTVRTESERMRAGNLAKVRGITKVNNELVVDRSTGVKGTSGAAEKTKRGLEKATEKTKEGIETATEKTKEGLSKTGEVITDTWITGRINMSFIGEDALKDSDIHVTTNNHVVTLTGTVASEAGRARVVAIAKGIEGVNRVVDQLKVGPKPRD